MNANHKKIIIIGSGPSGYTAAIYSSRASLSPLLISGPLTGGQLTTTTEVDNYPGFENGIMGPDLMIEMQNQAKRFGTEFLTETVSEVDFSSKPYKVITNNQTFTTDALIISTGANPRLLGLNEEKELMGYGVSTCATCDGAFFRESIITVVGGGDSACEEALFLTRFGKKVYLIHRRDSLRASKIMQEKVFANDKIEVIWDSSLKSINGSKEKGVNSIEILNLKTKETKAIETEAVFIAIGHTPNTQVFKDKLELDENGYIITKADCTKTSVEGVFACGDVKDHVYRQAITAAGSGCMAAIDAERYLELN